MLRKSDFDGGADQTNLEPSKCSQVLEELEDWTVILRAEPEVMNRLAAFSASAKDAPKDEMGKPVLADATPEEPSP